MGRISADITACFSASVRHFVGVFPCLYGPALLSDADVSPTEAFYRQELGSLRFPCSGSVIQGHR